MSRLLSGITISLDGYATGPDDRVGAGLGEGDREHLAHHGVVFDY